MVKKLLCAVIFIVSIYLVIKGNRIDGYQGLWIMLIGLGGLLSELYVYNKGYQ